MAVPTFAITLTCHKQVAGWYSICLFGKLKKKRVESSVPSDHPEADGALTNKDAHPVDIRFHNVTSICLLLVLPKRLFDSYSDFNFC